MASPSDVPRTDMAADEELRPIEMGESEHSLTARLDTTEAGPGAYRLIFTGATGQCAGQVVVN